VGYKMDLQIANRHVGKNHPCFIIAEAGVNHNGDIETAKKLIDIAYDAGADAVKFQTWVTEDIILWDTPKAAYQTEQTGDGTQYEMLKKLELSFDGFRELKKYADDKGIIFFSAADDERSAAFLNDIDVALYKIGSGEVNNILFLKYVARFNRPMIVSTGTATLVETRNALESIQSTGNTKIAMLHCTTDYPMKLEDVNMRVIQTLQKELGIVVGYSDNGNDMDVPLVALYLGAPIIEKHFTYDKDADGPDHAASLDPTELRELINRIREFEKMDAEEKESFMNGIPNLNIILGSPEKKPSDRELLNLPVIRKSIVARDDIPRGTMITEKNLIMKRSGGKGIPANEYKKILGKKTLKAIGKNTLIILENVE
jgi:N,N'-diacetyllegionaminate synthase